MHKPTRNESNLPNPGPQPDDLRDIRELNLLFLVLLQGRARRDADCFGLAAPVKRRLRDASDAAVEGMSRFPRTVFRLNLDCIKSGPDIPAERDGQLRRGAARVVVDGRAHGVEHGAATLLPRPGLSRPLGG